ncbi:glucose dehydrogenase [FAD, quinone]-like [Phymastichus coffea]|uniref:glucose dehydrogenase [FAD, quinone]-like n=1 Tax=Phymastichus coffea TaxID=108790 RepID=UPI00273C23CA|nr:glucose dehydrogenase [FAD, quinone]-like [Phymastichus coffea]
MDTNRSLSTLAYILIFVIGSQCYRQSGLVYRNLYGYVDDNTTVADALQILSQGFKYFFEENHRFVESRLKDTIPRHNQIYDYIVVGAGTAGATVASRLSEMKDATVLLIEAGPYENLLMDIPILVNHLQFNNQINWGYKTEKSRFYCQGMTNHQCVYPRGKVMGGSSVLNFMIATRGNRLDYDNWAAMGNEGWSYDEVLKYFKKLENMGIKDFKYDREMHNMGGPVHIEYPPYHTPLAESFLEAGLEMGYPIIDYNAKQDFGYSYIQATIKNGTRMSTNRAYLNPANHRKNLHVSAFSHVNKVLINPHTKRAYGVEFSKLGLLFEVQARREIILCAGAIGSAQILMLSGVGPAQHLKEMNIPIIQDAPVGDNMMDHIAYGGLAFLVDYPVSLNMKNLLDPVKPYLRDYLTRRSGPYTIPGGCEALAFIDVDNTKSVVSFPNMELLFIGASVISDPSFHKNVGISQEYWDKMFARVAGHDSWSIFPILMRPKSRGRILLRNRDPRSKPRIYANYLSDSEDVRILIEGIRAAIEISKTKAMRRFNSQFYDFLVPGCEDYEYDSNQYWECCLRTFTFNIYHYSGTCKMAPEDDPSGVVNPRLHVKGIQGLRVADASIMPMIITGHPNVPVIMIGEKLADMVKQDWGYDIDE